MTQKIKTVSVSEEENRFIDDNNISPTRLLRNKLQEMIDFQKNGLQNKELLAKVGRMQKIIRDHTQFLEKRGLIDEFLAYDSENN